MIKELMTALTLLSLTLLCCVNLSYAKVQIQINDTTYLYAANPRLNEVLSPVAGNDEWYWPSAQLFNLDKSNIEQQRQDVIQLLIDQGTNGKKITNAYQTLISQIQRWGLATRIPIKIDFDLARFSLAHNPKFESGNYLLTLSKRPNQLYIFGAVAAPITVNFPENVCVKDILSDIARLDNADVNQAYIISPTGQIELAPLAYWNHRCVVPMPGSSIYIPLQENQWSKKASFINQQVTSLALNRIQVP